MLGKPLVGTARRRRRLRVRGVGDAAGARAAPAGAARRARRSVAPRRRRARHARRPMLQRAATRATGGLRRLPRQHRLTPAERPQRTPRPVSADAPPRNGHRAPALSSRRAAADGKLRDGSEAGRARLPGPAVRLHARPASAGHAASTNSTRRRSPRTPLDRVVVAAASAAGPPLFRRPSGSSSPEIWRRIAGSASSSARTVWHVSQSLLIFSPSLGLVLAVVATEAARRVLVADVVRVGSPGDLHRREHVPGSRCRRAPCRRPPPRPPSGAATSG